jgi:hypothetical protein
MKESWNIEMDTEETTVQAESQAKMLAAGLSAMQTTVGVVLTHLSNESAARRAFEADQDRQRREENSQALRYTAEEQRANALDQLPAQIGKVLSNVMAEAMLRAEDLSERRYQRRREERLKEEKMRAATSAASKAC